ncbi:MAG: general secretion pathway protein GspK [Gemmataceae bacterium]|nr:general secretion pathway protein GspK [Gemmataceae bacterium]
MTHRTPRSRRAVVLLAVLVVVVLLSLAAYKYSELMGSEARAASSGSRAAQARAIAESGIAYTAALLANDIANDNSILGGNMWDNAQFFSGIGVPNDNPRDAGQFHIVSLSTPDDQARAYRPGVTDECGKINLNGLLALDKGKGEIALKILEAIPGMSTEVANAILDWLDEDDDERQGGAESKTYGTMQPSYRCKNGPLDSLEELLLVKGVTPELLFGGDRNRNGTLDKEEGGGGEVAGQGLSAYLTVYSREVNVSANGTQRINVNNKDLAKLKQSLTDASMPAEMVTYILAYRLYGGAAMATDAKMGGAAPPMGDVSALAPQVEDAISKGTQGKTKIESLWDLANTQVTASVGMGMMAKSVTVPSPASGEEARRTMLPAIFDLCCLNEKKDMAPRVNVLSAPSAVLAALGKGVGLTEEEVATIQSKRPDLTDTRVSQQLFKTPVWLLTEAGLKVETLKKLDKYITSRSQVYRFQSVGVFDKGGPSARVEAVVDTNQGRPRILYWRDLTELGRGFDIRPEGRK